MFWRAVAGIVGLGLVVFGLSTLDGDWITSPDQRAVAVALLPCSGLQSNASGFVIDDQTVVTVAHAVWDTRDVAVRDAFGTWHRPELVRLDLELDLAVLHVEGLRATPLESAPSRSADDWRGQHARLLNGTSTGFADAEIARRVKMDTVMIGDRSTEVRRMGYEVRLEIGPGDSGAAIVDDSDRLVGIVFARSTSRGEITWATAADELDRISAEIPEWDCGPDPGGRLDLRQSEPARLAG